LINPNDMAACRDAIRHGSLSFHAASKLLPSRVRDPALALYAFCRFADDEVDLTRDKAAAVEDLRARLDLVYRGAPRNAPADRAFADVVDTFEMPRALVEALIEGLAWDAEDRRYQDLSGLLSYSARVASAVGAMMCVLMRVRDPHVLARACDLGAAMQLTNIARDVGEDALERRLYLPLDWLDRAGVEPEAFLRDPRPTKPIKLMVRNLLIEADRLYRRSEAGIGALPVRSRPGIFAARYIYAGIGARLRVADYDPISARARTSRAQKSSLLALSLLRGVGTVIMPKSAIVYAKPLPETAFLVEAAAQGGRQSTWSDKVTTAMSQLAYTDQRRHNAGKRTVPNP
jgi:phytoene synthase